MMSPGAILSTEIQAGPAEAPSRGRSKAQRHIPALDGVRGIAILMVMFSHLIDGGASTSRIVRFVADIAHGGWAGVDLFFVLSGFLITGILLDTREEPHYFRNFYARRTLRIFPLYYGLLVFIFGVLPFVHAFETEGARDIQRHQAWLWLYGTNVLIAWTGAWPFNQAWLSLNHLWSLAVEEHFYLIWPAVVFVCGTRRLMGFLCVGCAAAVLAGRLVAGHLGVNDAALYVFTPFRIDALALGGLAAVLARGPGGIAALVRPAWGMLAGSAIVLGVMLWRHGAEIGEVAGRSRYFTPLASFFTSALILAVSTDITATGAKGLAGRFFAHPVLRFFGRYSYGLYVIESSMQPVYQKWFSTQRLQMHLHSFEIAGLLHLVLCVVCSLALAVISFHFYEKPFLRLKTFFEARKPPDASQVQVEPPRPV